MRRGHEVTLFASGDSRTTAQLSSVFPKNLYDTLGKFDWSDSSYNMRHTKACFDREAEFDIIHNHLGPEVLTLAADLKTPVITTMHSSLPPDFPDVADKVKHERFVSISNAQRKIAPYFNWIGTVYHGLNERDFMLNEKPDDYLLFIGTLGPTKGVDIAIRVAKRLGLKLILAGDRRPEFDDFFTKEVAPYIDGSQIKMVGEIGQTEKVNLYQNAQAFLFPVRWNEAFGLVVAESMLCGTPVVGSRNGSLPEIVDDGVTGFTASGSDEEALARAVVAASQLNRAQVRQRALQRFTVKVMADGYEKLYSSVLRVHS